MLCIKIERKPLKRCKDLSTSGLSSTPPVRMIKTVNSIPSLPDADLIACACSSYQLGIVLGLPGITVPVRILHKTSQHPTSSLQERMPNYDLEETLQSSSAVLNHCIVESVQVDFARERRNANPCALPLE